MIQIKTIGGEKIWLNPIHIVSVIEKKPVDPALAATEVFVTGGLLYQTSEVCRAFMNRLQCAGAGAHMPLPRENDADGKMKE